MNRYLKVLETWWELAGRDEGALKERVNQWETGRWRR